jgi:hypothetical protein
MILVWSSEASCNFLSTAAVTIRCVAPSACGSCYVCLSPR